MNHSYPIFTAEAECQDCFKCVRQCPVKAICVREGHASVIPELCIACGGCVQVCPVHAKKVRNDIGRVRCLMQDSKVPVYASLAPSWVNEFRGLPAANMIAALRKLGFAGVSETALGAQIVSEASAAILRKTSSGLIISSACPVAVDFIRKYFPELAGNISPVLSPALSHAKFLRQQFGSEIKVVFIGPCIAKKNESDRHPEDIDIAILFPRLRQWFKEENIEPFGLETTDRDVFVPYPAKEGALYPIEGGMNRTVMQYPESHGAAFLSVAGLDSIRQALDGLNPERVTEPVFLEALACVGGCVHGPGTGHNSPGILERLRVLRSTKMPEKPTLMPNPGIGETYSSDPVAGKPATLKEIRDVLSSIGKSSSEQEINCGGCGYFTCHNFAQALLEGKAEPNMCVSHLRKLAQKKSNAIMRCIPAAVVICGATLGVIESNRRFAELAGDAASALYDRVPGLAGINLAGLVSFSGLFKQVLESGEEYHCDSLRFGDRLLSIDIFNIEPSQVVGAIIFDVTRVELCREEIAGRAQEVIEKNLSTVQEIACRLGENMAETEILLRSIAEKYSGRGQEGGQKQP